MAGDNPTDHTRIPGETLAFFESSIEQRFYEPAIDGPIVLDALPFSENPWSPTPLDPYKVKTTEGLEYYDAALELMLDRFDRRVKNTNLDPVSSDLIRKEIENFHLHRCMKNIEGFARLRIAIGENRAKLTDPLRMSIYRARAGQSDLMDDLDILTTFPEMEAIGGIQFTEPFNVPLMQKVASSNLAQVIEELHAKGIKYEILDEKPNYMDPRPQSDVQPAPRQDFESLSEAIEAYARHKEELARSPFVIVKKPLLRIFYNERIVEMVEGTNPFIAPLSPPLEGVPKNIQLIPGKGKANLQNVSYGTYYRDVPKKIPNDMLFVESHGVEVEPSLAA